MPVTSILILLMMLTTIVIFLVGMIRPKLVVPARFRATRANVIVVFSGLFLATVVLAIVVAPPEQAGVSDGEHNQPKTAEFGQSDIPDAPVALCLSAADKEFCEFTRQKFIKEWPQAWAGDYQAQRNTAFCLSTSCDTAVNLKPILGCAWYKVIMASGNIKVDQTDAGNVKVYCGRLEALEQNAAVEQAKTLFLAIYQRALPVE